LSDAPWVTIYDFVYPRPTPSRHRETPGRRSDKVSAPPDYACKRKGQKTVKSHGIRDRNHTHSNDDTMGSGIESIPYTQYHGRPDFFVLVFIEVTYDCSEVCW
jgi:hypothetical protein